MAVITSRKAAKSGRAAHHCVGHSMTPEVDGAGCLTINTIDETTGRVFHVWLDPEEARHLRDFLNEHLGD